MTKTQVGLYETLKERGVERELAFPASEYQRRLAAVQAAMRQRGIDLLIASNAANCCYLSGYDSCMPPAYGVLLVPADGEMTLHCAEIEAPVAMYHSIIDDMVMFDWYNADDTATELAGLLKDRGYETSTIGIEMANLESFASGAYDTASYLRLVELLPQAEFVDGSELVLDQRIIKTEAELEYMREAGRITEVALNASIEATHEGVNENAIAAAAYNAAALAGSEVMSIDPMILTGPRSGLMPHLPYRRHMVGAGDVVYMEYSGTYWRYNAPSMRSTVIGPAGPRLEKLAATSIEVLSAVMREAAPGRTGHDVASAVAPLWEQTPGAFFHGGYAYAIGMGSQPTWTEAPVYIAIGAERELEPGMCFHVPINPVYPGEFGVGFSESIVITSSGCEQLTPKRPCELVVR
jgi:Xaa-Pro dipeptidase